jgi:hypothetical protein
MGSRCDATIYLNLKQLRMRMKELEEVTLSS